MFKFISVLFFAVSMISAAQIVQLTGNCLVNGKDGHIGQTVMMGDRVKAKDESRVIIKLASGTGITIKNGTEILVNEYPVQQEEDEPIDTNYVPKTRLRLIRGYIQAVVKKGSDFKIATPTATAAVRGTVFFTRHNDLGSYFCTCNGSVDYTTVEDNVTKNITATHHKGISISNGGTISPAKMEDHTDAEILELKKAIE